jgi:hypothetical protein
MHGGKSTGRPVTHGQRTKEAKTNGRQMKEVLAQLRKLTIVLRTPLPPAIGGSNPGSTPVTGDGSIHRNSSTHQTWQNIPIITRLSLPFDRFDRLALLGFG